MKANIGIRRRLAPLLENDRKPARAVHRAAAVAAGLAGAVLRRRDRHGRQHLAGRPGRRPGRRCSGPRTATAASPRSTRSGSTCRRSWTRSTATRPLNVEAQQRNAGSLLHWTRRISRSASGTQSSAPALRGADLLQPERAGLRPVAGRLGRRRTPTARTASCASTTCPGSRSRSNLDLRRFMGVTTVECMGGVTFPRIASSATC